jgi:glycosyltransferase involved in cell wall biosynthesis
MMMKRRFFSQMTDAAICVSSVMKDYADTALKIRNTYVVPNGSDPEQFSPFKRDEGLYGENRKFFKVLWSGSADYPWQGVEIVLKVAESVYEMDKEVKFILITNPTHLSNQRLFYKNVVLIGQKPYLDIASYIASADAGLCLYQNYGWNGRFYFSPLKLFDYMSSGLPVIASALGQITEAIQDQVSGILTDNDIEDIAQKIVRLKRNRQEAKQLGMRARIKVVEYYNWERVAQQTESILKEFVKQ